MGTAYETDIVAWANEQAALLRSGDMSAIDIEHVAEEIEDVGKSEQRELRSRMSVLLAHLLKWQYQPERRGNSWGRTIREQRKGIVMALEDAPSLKIKLDNDEWVERVWSDALAQAMGETDLDVFPEKCPWSMKDVLEKWWVPKFAVQQKVT